MSDENLTPITNKEIPLEDIRKRYSWVKDPTEDVLSDAFPSATPEERFRFLIARNGKVEAASVKLGAYLEWRESINLDKTSKFLESLEQENFDRDDESAWNCASQIALDISKEESSVLPRVVRFLNEDMLDYQGKRICQVFGASVDLKLAKPETYALAIAIYLDMNLSRNSMEKICVSIDVRSGYGWANQPAQELIPFAKTVSGLLSDHFPERMSLTVLFPVPTIAYYLWKIVKIFLDPETARKVQVVAGKAETESPVPAKKLIDYFDEKVIVTMEGQRLASFIHEQ